MIVLGHGSGPGTVYIDAFLDTSDVSIHDCAAIVPQWYINPLAGTWTGFEGFTSPPATLADFEALRADMITAGDVAIKSGEGAKLRNLAIYGFDNCIWSAASQDFFGENVAMDCNVGLYIQHSGGQSTIKDFNNNPFLMKQGANEEYWNIADVDRNDAGECTLKLTVSGGGFGLTHIHSSKLDSDHAVFADPGRGDPYFYPGWVAGLKGKGLSCSSAGTGAFGNDAAWGIETTTSGADYQWIRLIGSHYSPNSDSSHDISTTGDWDANTGIIHVKGSIANLTPGMVAAAGGAGWPAGNVTVKGVVQRCTGPDPGDGYNGCIIVSPPPTASASDVTITFSDPTGTLDGAACDKDGGGRCFFFSAAERYVAGNSDAGEASAALAGARGGHLGAGFLIDHLSGVRMSNVFSYGHYYHTAAIDSGICNVIQAKGDDHGEIGSGHTVGFLVTGDSHGCVFVSQSPGRPGASLVVDTFAVTDIGAAQRA